MSKSENIFRSKWSMLFNNFLGGIAWAFGVWVGTAIIAIFVFQVISKLDLAPMVGDFVDQVIQHMENNRNTIPFQ